MHSTNERSFSSAATRWNTYLPHGIRFSEHSMSFDPEVNVVDTYRRNRYLAMLTQKDCPNGIWSGNEVELWFNDRYINYDMSIYERGSLAAHELGHALGLADVNLCTIMKPVIPMCSPIPTSPDILGVSDIYFPPLQPPPP